MTHRHGTRHKTRHGTRHGTRHNRSRRFLQRGGTLKEDALNALREAGIGVDDYGLYDFVDSDAFSIYIAEDGTHYHNVILGGFIFEKRVYRGPYGMVSIQLIAFRQTDPSNNNIILYEYVE